MPKPPGTDSADDRLARQHAVAREQLLRHRRGPFAWRFAL